MTFKMKQPSLLFILLTLLSVLGLSTNQALAQTAEIKESQQTMTTYPFGDPDPVPALERSGRGKLYPYFKYEGYSSESKEEKWTVIDMENDYIKVSILPEVGGKIWGAIEKATNNEFIYLNEVLKFRNIALRGPWTSGGIEFNFGIKGHTPSTATPVDYILQENIDGSVSCIVGGLDLASRTEWRVNILLPKDKAYFETKSLWYNPTPVNVSYYQWMNVAIKASDDLQFFFPGEYQVSHYGDAHPWPINDDGINLSYYKNNNFEGNKSYHILGKYTSHSGAYYHKNDFGYGHWSLYDQVPGKKIWIWSLARSGAIWEDLLTDDNGQYVEVQSGRLFSQANNESSDTPFTHVGLAPSTTDTWSELWFPVKETGGIDASPYGVLNVTKEDRKLQIALNALQDINDNISVTIDGKQIFHEDIALGPMDVYKKEVSLPSSNGHIQVNVGKHLSYNSDPDHSTLDRPVISPEGAAKDSAERTYQYAEDDFHSRNYSLALEKYFQVLEKEPVHSLSKTRIAEILYARGKFNEGLKYVSEVLAHNTYDPGANYMFGIINIQKGDFTNAKEALGWAARSMEFRSAAYAQMAGIFLQEEDYTKAKVYASRAMEFNTYNINAYKMLAMTYRKLHQNSKAEEVLAQLLEIDPVNYLGASPRGI